MAREPDYVLIWAVDEAFLSSSDSEADRITSVSISNSDIIEVHSIYCKLWTYSLVDHTSRGLSATPAI